MGSEIHPEDIAMLMLEEVPKDARKAFEEHQRVAEEHRRVTEAKEQMQQMMEESIDKFFRKLNISFDSLVAHVDQRISNSSTTHVSVENTQFNISLNYFPSQAPSARNIFFDK
jgi:galactitol-specific phosphotransferase system IIB component